ncbi:hypothetical protein BD414DRAFT_518532 [Trametes punicea]|nr:hypothetical protein BD414DRAFT_518532 [Trametes punicea]
MPAPDSKHKDNEPTADAIRDAVLDADRDRERDKDKDKDKGAKHAKSSTKNASPLCPLLESASSLSLAKDLSHVLCKFFKVGSCTAGASCPFSHQVLEPGQPKEVCAWFVKGNCKFGHKCTLAHILPGQSMSMDRKNKEAAQLAASAAGTVKDGNKSSKAQKFSHHGGANRGSGSSSAQSRNALFSGSTAPTRTAAHNARNPIPVPLKATLSPSAPAPPVKDTDFASFGLPDEANKLPSAPAHGKSSSPTEGAAVQDQDQAAHPEGATPDQERGLLSADGPHPPSQLSTSTPSTPRRVTDASAAVDLGPIGSPPHAASSSNQTTCINGFSPGTSPQAAAIPSSPFSAPGRQSVFALFRREDTSSDVKARSGLSASLGAILTWSSERITTRHMVVTTEASVVEDEDLEDFLPSSLTDLLMPEECSRRLSRTNLTRPRVAGPEREPSQQRSGTKVHHRYSRSVSAPSLLQDIRSIWSDTGPGAVSSPGMAAIGPGHLGGGGLGNGTLSSFTSNSRLGSRVEDMLSPSNASAAFLPGLHHYFNAKSQRPAVALGHSSMYSGAGSNLAAHALSSSASAYGHNTNGATMSPLRAGHFLNCPSFDQVPNDSYLQPASLRLSAQPMAGGDAYGPGLDDHRSAMSPSVRALQAHAPGQSLLQGLATEYSRIHALPPPVIPSPLTSSVLSRTPMGSFSPGTKTLGHTYMTSGNWASIMETIFSRLSYPAAASRTVTPSGMGPRGSLGPLSRPMLTGEDDDLFSME